MSDAETHEMHFKNDDFSVTLTPTASHMDAALWSRIVETVMRSIAEPSVANPPNFWLSTHTGR